MSIDQLSVGSIIPYAADNVGPILQIGWALCDGSSLKTADYPHLFAVIGYTNGGAKDSFLLPDLRGRFLRGNFCPQRSLWNVSKTNRNYRS